MEREGAKFLHQSIFTGMTDPQVYQFQFIATIIPMFT